MTVSVIIPIYNAAQYLAECIDSVLGQTMSDFELLLVDDGSTDESAEICERYAARDPRVRLFRQSNAGVSVARNRGLDHARGAYVVFVDADDWVDADHLEQLLACGMDDESICFTNAYLDYDLQLEEVDVSGIRCSRALAQLRRQTYFGWTWNKIFSRKLIERHHLRFNENMRLHEDELFSAEYCVFVSRVCVRNRRTYHYRIQDSGLLHSKKPSAEKLYCYRKLHKTFSSLDAENRYLTLRIHLSCCCHTLRHCWAPDNVRHTLMYVNAAYSEYRQAFRKEFMRDERDYKVARRSRWVFRYKSGFWIWLSLKFINV